MFVLMETICPTHISTGIDPKKWSLQSRRFVEVNEVACLQATGLTYCNVEWVNTRANLPTTRLTLHGFSPFQALTRSKVPAQISLVAQPARCTHSTLRKARLHLDTSRVDGSCRDERTRERPQSLLCALVSSGEPTTGKKARTRLAPPPASTRSLLMRQPSRAAPPHRW